MTPAQRKLVIELLRALAREGVRAAAILRALADTLDAPDVCMSYGDARENGERTAAERYDDAR